MEINILYEIINRLQKIASKSHFSGQDSCHSVPGEYRLSIVLVDFYNSVVSLLLQLYTTMIYICIV